jgi:transcriptional regulator with XRE-family HTH domain
MSIHAQYIAQVQVQNSLFGPDFQDDPYNADMTSRTSSPVGRRIAELRKNAGLTQRQLADQIGTAWSNVAYWERGASAPPGTALVKLAPALGVSVDELLGTVKPKPKKTVAQGRLQKVFEEVSKLPRRQQQKVVEMAEGFLSLQRNGTTSNGH